MSVPSVVVVGLGPGSPEHVTDGTRRLIATIPARFVRTVRHPAAGLVADATAFDDAARHGSSGEADIVERLVEAARRHGTVLYAVPGSPLVLEPVVVRLRTDRRVNVAVHPAASFLDMAWMRLGIDPVACGVRLVDVDGFVADAARRSAPTLVAGVEDRRELRRVAMAFDDADPGGAAVTALTRLGSGDESIRTVAWSELEETVEPIGPTCLYVPELPAPSHRDSTQLHQLVRTLREQCPWDRAQDHASLVPYLIEEAFELVDALSALDPDDPATDESVVEELGDVLFQIEFHAVIAEQEGRFSIADVTRTVHDKLVRRHPHVFAGVEVNDAETVIRNWDEIKATEKSGRTSRFDGVARSLPALGYVQQLQRKAAKIGFDWPDVAGPLSKVAEELDELRDAIDSHGDIAGEIGDLVFAVVNTARHLGVDAEVAARAAATKFRRRFEGVESLAQARSLTLDRLTLEELDRLWDEVKRTELRPGDLPAPGVPDPKPDETTTESTGVAGP